MIFVILISTISLSAQTEDSREKFDPARNPFEDLKSAVGFTTESNKRIILDVGGEWCIWCHRIDAFMQSTEEIKPYLKKIMLLLKLTSVKRIKMKNFYLNIPQ